MNTRSVTQLPPPPAGKTGWPWTEDSSTTTKHEGALPTVAVVTPSYNQAQFLEETIRSVLLQDYENLEYVIMDGGSTDGSVDVIRRYDRWLTHWESKPDGGQCRAINQGWQRTTGEYLAWLNSDDTYLPGTLLRAADALHRPPSSAMIYGDGLWYDEGTGRSEVIPSEPFDAELLLNGTSKYNIPQPTAFMTRSALRSIGWLDEDMHMAMDLDLWLKLALRYELKYVPGPPSALLRAHPEQKVQIRVMEDLVCSLRARERAFDSPDCPSGMSRKGNAPIARIYLSISGNHLRARNPLRSLSCFAQALRVQPIATLARVMRAMVIGTYRSIIPSAVRTWVRNKRHRKKADTVCAA